MALSFRQYVDSLLADQSIERLRRCGEEVLLVPAADNPSEAPKRIVSYGNTRSDEREAMAVSSTLKRPSTPTARPAKSPSSPWNGFNRDGSSYFDFGDGRKWLIPPFYDALAVSLRLPSLDDVWVDEKVLETGITESTMIALMADDEEKQINRAQRPQPPVTYESNNTFQFHEEGHYTPGTHGNNRHHQIQSFNSQGPSTHYLGTDPRWGPLAVAKDEADRQSRAWSSLVRKDLPRWHKNFFLMNRKQVVEAKKVVELCQREVRNRMIRSVRVARQAPVRTKRLARDMIILWKKIDKEQAEVRKREEREALEARKREDEMREARRQQQRLNFLLTQTELYSHFMQTKVAGTGAMASMASVKTDLEVDESLSEEEKAEVQKLKEEAVRAAESAAMDQQLRTDAFDRESSKLRVELSDALSPSQSKMDDMDLLNPSTMPAMSSVSQPQMFKGILKEYQLKGLQWLVNLYEQGLNGILADEMGLGKTIQAMSFLSHLAEEKNIWGPFLIVAPASVLSNWADELAKFLPDFRVLPYWGGTNERAILRKNLNPKRLYKREASFHALVTSYQLMVTDEKHFRKVKWQYMVLDEAQAIKSANSIRWKSLLSFNCRNRLLLTGTPVQNSMAELWALLHFIMPTLFDSHEQFNEWFSKGIEGHAEHGGTLNEHQLSRLHSILKPFMLRRVKKDVEVEMLGKVEITVPCPLSMRQRQLYEAIKHKISLTDLFDSVAGHGSEKKVLHLMNIVIQLRKVCNHPELFERNEGRTFFHFATMANSLNPAAFGELDEIWFSGRRNAISYQIPRLLVNKKPSRASSAILGFEEKWLSQHLSIFSPHNSIQSMAFLNLLDLSPSEAHFLATASLLERWLFGQCEIHGRGNLPQLQGAPAHQSEQEAEEDSPRFRAVRRLLLLPLKSHSSILTEKQYLGPAQSAMDATFDSLVRHLGDRMSRETSLLRATRGYTPPVLAPQVDIWCSDRGFAYQQQDVLYSPETLRLMVGWARTSQENGPHMPPHEHPLIEELEHRGQMRALFQVPHQIFGSAPFIQTVDIAKMLTDSGKLHSLDQLLRKLRLGGHRVLVFAQMTKMLNILEDYMNYRKYKYLRLDGSSTIMDRRDMVKDFQQRSDIFVFLLSTRAGGLGINLTAADTVIFYESDWNPTMDLQAMDRAHRLGQTKEVTVYRLICEGTIEEKIVKRANQKNTVQQLVMTGGKGSQPGDVFNAEEVVSLLLDDAEMERKLREQAQAKPERSKRKGGFLGGTKNIRLDAEGSAFVEEDAAEPAATPGTSEKKEEPTAPEEAVNKTKKSSKRKSTSDATPKPPKAPKAPKPPKTSTKPSSGKKRKSAPTSIAE